jgi:hypothetical protein
METLNRAKAVVEKAEKELRHLLSEAASAGDYDCLVTLTDWARQLAAIPEQSTSPVKETPANGSAAAPNGRRSRAGANRRPSRKREYPKFVRTKNDLVKIGWSKSEKSTYEHKAPKSVVGLLAHALVRAGQDGRQFSMDDVLPLKPSAGDSEVPSYQAYLAMAWFRVETLVKQHGRQGYSVPAGINLPDEAERRWGNLPPR